MQVAPNQPTTPEKPVTPPKTEEEIKQEKIKVFEDSFVKALKGTTLYVTDYGVNPDTDGL